MVEHKIWNEDCFETLRRFEEDGTKINVVMTSPPYNNSRQSGSMERNTVRYDLYMDCKSDTEYGQWTEDLFRHFDKVLVKDGVVLYNISYGSEGIESFFEAINGIRRANFEIADIIVWKKRSAIPNNTSSNKLTRLVEFVFVCCRKEEWDTYQSNKQVTSVRDTGQMMYENVYNFIEAPNNDGSCNLNKATYSSELVAKLLMMYAKPNDVVYDPFMGTGTTVVGCHRFTLGSLTVYGSELSEAQCKYAEDRIKIADIEYGSMLF